MEFQELQTLRLVNFSGSDDGDDAGAEPQELPEEELLDELDTDEEAESEESVEALRAKESLGGNETEEEE